LHRGSINRSNPYLRELASTLQATSSRHFKAFAKGSDND